MPGRWNAKTATSPSPARWQYVNFTSLISTLTTNQLYTEKIRPEIEVIQPLITKRISDSPRFQSLYSGWKVWFSSIIDKPHILFLGINPGPGEGGVIDFEPDGQLQYIYDQSSNWHLKNDTIEIINHPRVGEKVDLDNCVKTNYYYLGTNNFDAKFYELIAFLGRQKDNEGLGDLFLRKSKLWTQQLILTMKPRLIICEGAEAFKLLTKYALEEEVNETKSDVITYRSKKLGINVIGYSRKWKTAGIKNKELLIEHLIASL